MESDMLLFCCNFRVFTYIVLRYFGEDGWYCALGG